MCGFTGIHTMPPDQALVPPTVSAFSNSPTLAPSAAARIGGAQGRGAGSQDDDIERFHRDSLTIGPDEFLLSHFIKSLVTVGRCL